jgi:asparagine N-glycosylation enzyme membrane subunit Stt3
VKTGLRIIILVLVLGIGFYLRFNHGYARSIKSGITFVTPDPYYHLRRILLATQNFPHLPGFDYYLSYPTGAHCIWPPLFDFTCATLAYAIGMGHPDVGLTESVASVYPIIYALLIIILTYLIGREVFKNEYIGLISAAIVSIIPANVMFSAFGFTDHHIAESFGLLLIVYTMIRRRDRPVHAVFLGLSMSIALLLWQGSIFFAGIAFLYLYLCRSRERYVAIAFFLAALIILPFSFQARYFGGWFTHRGLSLLYVGLLTLSGILLLMKYYIGKRWLLVLIVGVIAAAFIFFMQSHLKEAFDFLTKNAWTQRIPGYQSLMSLSRDYISTSTVNKIFGLLYYLWPIITCFMYFDKRIEKRHFMVYLVVVIGAMNFLVTQYSVWFSPIFGLLIGYLLYSIYEFLIKQPRSLFRFLAPVIIAIILFLGFRPVFSDYTYVFEEIPNPLEYPGYIWLRDSTQTTSYYTEPTKKPEYGVMSFYKHAHFIIYIAERPAIANNFGKDAPNFEVPNRFLLSTDEDEANNILSQYNARYILCDQDIGIMYLAVGFLGYPISDFFDMYPTRSMQGEVSTALMPKPRALRSMYYRLVRFDGCGRHFEDDVDIEPIRHSRLVYVSNDPRPTKIFEYVKACRIMGRARPRQCVHLEIPVILHNYQFVWSDSLIVDQDGNFMFTCPYDTDQYPGVFIAGKDTTEIHITNENVLNGDTIQLNL